MSKNTRGTIHGSSFNIPLMPMFSGSSMFGGPREQSDVPVTAAIQPLNTNFATFGEALFSWVNSGAGSSGSGINPECAIAFNRALGCPTIQFDSDDMLLSRQYLPTTQWLVDFLEVERFHRIGNGTFITVDEGNRPRTFLDFSSSRTHNVRVLFSGPEDLGLRLRAAITKNVLTDIKESTKPDFISIDGIDEDGDCDYNRKKVQRARQLTPEFYPYLDGGVKALISEFLASDETVMVLIGPPGTGKSSAVIAGITELNLLPIYATKPDVILHPVFVSKMFQISDSFMDKLDDSEARQRQDLFQESALHKVEFGYKSLITPDIEDDEDEDDETDAQIPILVVEDADLLLRPRSEGNVLMSQLLNETDGVNSNHARKIIFTTNLENESFIEPALLRPGRCFGVISFRELTADEAVIARAAGGLPKFEVEPTEGMSLAAALRKPRKRIEIKDGQVAVGVITRH